MKERLIELFYKHGLPEDMLSDNRPPFGPRGIDGPSWLDVWLLRIGLGPVLIQPSRPDQDWPHERFHESLKAETASPPRSSIRAQQRAFDRFQGHYNSERSREALGMRTPDEVCMPSGCTASDDDSDFEYGCGAEVRRVRKDGAINWGSAYVFTGEAVAGELVGIGLSESSPGEAWLGPMRLGVVNDRLKTVVPLGLLE